MPDLVAQGPQRRDRWRRRLPQSGESVVVGRESAGWSVGWDRHVSRLHVRLTWQAPLLRVERLTTATNPVFYQGAARDRFSLRMGEHFVIGGTTFTLSDHHLAASLDLPVPDNQQTFAAESLRAVDFRQAHQQIYVLTRLPELIAAARSEEELYSQLVNLLLTGLREAEAVAVVRLASGLQPPLPAAPLGHGEPEPEPADGASGIEVLHWDQADTDTEPFLPSAALIQAAVPSQQSVVHAWRNEERDSAVPAGGAGIPSTGHASPIGALTPSSDSPAPRFRWAFCSPLPGNACLGIAIYVTGQSSTTWGSDALQDALKFAELVGTTVGNACEVRRLERRAAQLDQFFSEPVRRVVAASDPERALAPREAELTVLFCDLRGFSRTSEQMSHDLLGLLARVSEALGLVTQAILAAGGVIGDFHGDAVMGFWGWPLANPRSIEAACRTALQIATTFHGLAAESDHPLHGFRVSLGLATGPAVAGKIGTRDQVKVTAFGPVVNLAARLEALTRFFAVPMLLDQTTAERALQVLPPDIAQIRSLGRVRPQGMNEARNIFELAEPSWALHADWHVHREEFARGLDAFQQGDWVLARQCFALQSPHDGAARCLRHWIDRHHGQPPPAWDGALSPDVK